ncbi:MAG: leucyl aminopeptidase family protein [Alphaproteobacteria bacterium]|nr:leucyl aminopeptidase family protein [Alphaproteobacteria bacterium]
MNFLPRKTAASIAVTPVTTESLGAWLKKQDAATRNWVEAAGFTAAKGALLPLPGTEGKIAQMLYGIEGAEGLYTFAELPGKLPAHEAGYYIDSKMTEPRATLAALGWALGSYNFSAYKTTKKKTFPALVWPEKADRKAATAAAEAMFLVRDLINTPPNDLGPAEIAEAAKKLAKADDKATIKIITGETLAKEYPAVHAVGKGSPRGPRLIDIRWGSNAKHPLVTLVGKGVAFDTGGLDIKPDTAMLLMKKDMGGAAHVLGVAHMVMAAKLPVRLRVLVPAVENSVSGESFRPSDVIDTRKGLKVEVGNTDAEGRLILCDALAEACRDKPDLIVDFATLTGAARVALGPDLPAMFASHDKTANALLSAATRVEDPLWRLPLWQPYHDMLRSKVADTNNVGGSFGGAITAALFLQKFVDADIPWVHIDTYGWMPSAKPGRPEGGEALGMRAVYEMLAKTYGRKKRK